MSFSEQKPFVSVIVPVYNGASLVAKNIEALLKQDYPKELLEIIIVDNGSTDNTLNMVKKYPIILLQENEIQTSYAARNKGILQAKGGIIAFTDADCIPKPNWVSQGVKVFTETGTDMAGGKISFTFSEKPTAAEYLDSIINLHNESSIIEKSGAKTANLFVKRELFEKVGFFKSDQKSGEDIGWTGRASRVGFKIVYGGDMIVEHPARKFSELLEKHFRVGMGSVGVWKSQGRNIFWIVARWISLFLPMLSARIPFLVKRRGMSGVQYPVFKMIGIAWMCTITTALGIISWMRISKKRDFSKIPRHAAIVVPEYGLVYEPNDSWKDFIQLVILLMRERKRFFIHYLIRAKFSKQAYSLILKKDGRVIGGSVFSRFPLIPEYFDKEILQKMKELTDQGYQYGASFFIMEKYRDQGFGTMLMERRMQNNRIDYYFIPSHRTEDFYIRIGARKYYEGKESLYVVDKNKSPQPLVSVIIPVFNRARNIIRAIETVKAQTYPNWELIIVDDASTDTTRQIIQNIEKQDSRIRTIHREKNGGVATARNMGIIQSIGDYVAFLDSDDMWIPEKLERQVEVFESSLSDVGLVYTGVTIIDCDGNSRDKHASAQGNIADMLMVTNPIGTSSRVMIRRKCIASCGVLDESLPILEDRDYWLRIAQKYRVVAIPDSYVKYYESPDAISQYPEIIKTGYQKFLGKHHITWAMPVVMMQNRFRMMHHLWYRKFRIYHTLIFYVTKYFS